MRTIKMFTVIALAIIMLVGCTSNRYKLNHKNGDYYIDFNLGGEVAYNGGNQQIAPFVCFGSVAEMVDKIRTGDFTESQLKQIARFSQDENGQIKICNLDEMLEPVFPDTLDQYQVIWSGTSYSFSFLAPGEQRIVLSFTTKDYFDVEVNKNVNFKEWITSTNNSIDQIKEEKDRNATAYYYTTSSGLKVKKLTYTIGEGNDMKYIDESYWLDSSSEVPNSIHIYGISQGQYYYVSVIYPSERPSVEWLSSFALKEYEG